MQKAQQAWTFADSAKKAVANTVAATRGSWPSRAAQAWGLGQFGREVFCPWRQLEVVKPWQTRTFAVAELAPSMTLKSYWVQKPYRP